MGLPQCERGDESYSHEDWEYGERLTIGEVAVESGTVNQGSIPSKVY